VILADYVEARYNDNAARFDITEETEVDIANQIKKNVKRGLGLHMLQKMTDELTYKRKGKRNYTMLRLRRNRSTIPVEG